MTELVAVVADSNITALDLIEDALREIGVLSEDATATASQASDALRLLNRILEQFANQRWLVHTENLLSYPLADASPFTIGPSGADMTASRPLKVLSAYATSGDMTYPVAVLSASQWDGLPPVPAGSAPSRMYVAATYPNVNVYVDSPTTGYTLSMRVQSLLTAFATTATTCALPPGYDDLLVLTLATRLAPSYSVKVSPETTTALKQVRRDIKRINATVPVLEGMQVVSSRTWFNSGGL